MADKSKGKCSVDTVRMSKSKGMSEDEKPVEAAEELLTPVILNFGYRSILFQGSMDREPSKPNV